MEKKVTMKSTKDEIFTRLKEVQSNLDQVKRENLQHTKKKLAVSKIDNSASSQIGQLNDAIGTINYVKSVYDDLSKINEAIDFKKKQLQELADIEYSVNTLEALIQADKEATKSHERNIKELSNDYQYQTFALETRQNRKIEEFDYDYKMLKKKKNDELVEEETKRRKVIQEEEKELTKKIEEFREKEAKINNYEERIKELEEGRTQAINEAVKAELGKQRAILTKDFSYEMDLKEVKNDAEIRALEEKLLLLDKNFNNEVEKNNELSEKLSKAYDKIESIAAKTVESSSDKALSMNLQEILKNIKKENNSK